MAQTIADQFAPRRRPACRAGADALRRLADRRGADCPGHDNLVAASSGWRASPVGISRCLRSSRSSRCRGPARDNGPCRNRFFVPDPELLHQPVVVLRQDDDGSSGARRAATHACWAPLVSWCLLARARQSPPMLAFVAPLAAAALPFVAFYAGHPYRVRYLVPSVLAAAVLASIALTAFAQITRLADRRASPPRRFSSSRRPGRRPPLDPQAPMVVEAQWETPFRLERETVTAALVERDDGSPILASMGSLAHYMHETSRAGFALGAVPARGQRRPLARGAQESPRRSVRWILIEERAEGGDVLAARARHDPDVSGRLRARDRGRRTGALRTPK